jgi:hypothetical protein
MGEVAYSDLTLTSPSEKREGVRGPVDSVPSVNFKMP